MQQFRYDRETRRNHSMPASQATWCGPGQGGQDNNAIYPGGGILCEVLSLYKPWIELSLFPQSQRPVSLEGQGLPTLLSSMILGSFVPRASPPAPKKGAGFEEGGPLLHWRKEGLLAPPGWLGSWVGALLGHAEFGMSQVGCPRA